MFDISVINLKRAVFRRGLSMGFLVGSGFPLEDIYIHEARDGADYKDTVLLCEAAVRAGYPLFERSLVDKSYTSLHVGVAALTWSWHEICKRVIERDIPTVVLHDDVRPLYGYRDFVNLVDGLNSYDKDWKFVNLSLHTQRGSFDMFREDMAKYRVYGTGMIQVVFGMYSQLEDSVLVSPAGARWLLEEMYPSSFINMDDELFDVDAWMGCSGKEIWSTPEIFFMYLTCFVDFSRSVGGVYTVWAACFDKFKRDYVGSYIYDVDAYFERDEWVFLSY